MGWSGLHHAVSVAVHLQLGCLLGTRQSMGPERIPMAILSLSYTLSLHTAVNPNAGTDALHVHLGRMLRIGLSMGQERILMAILSRSCALSLHTVVNPDAGTDAMHVHLGEMLRIEQNLEQGTILLYIVRNDSAHTVIQLRLRFAHRRSFNSAAAVDVSHL